jgi:hypothetical protein
MGWEDFYDLSGGIGDDIWTDVDGWTNGRRGYNFVD